MDFKPFKIGKYLLLEKIATGGMAEVYRAKASGAGGFEKQLAIKRILPSYSANEEFRRMFEYEARLSSMLTHANIVQIYDFVKSGETYLLAMEYVDGKNLRQFVNKAKKVGFLPPLEFGVYVINEVCKGLEYAHKKKDDLNGKPLNIIHRDMSPQNIMLSYDGAVKIVDFGIAKAKDRVDETRSGVIKGKFGYMSPEQANGEPVDHRTDIFSTGIILWELLTGKRLFAADNDMATLKQIRECVVPPASKSNPKVSGELEKILMKALTKDLGLRYQNAGVFHRQLQEFLNKYYPSYTQREVAEVFQRIFTEEIAVEKKRFEQIYRQSIPFSQGAARPDEEGGDADAGADGSITRSERGDGTAVTNFTGESQADDGSEEFRLESNESTGASATRDGIIGNETQIEPVILEDEKSVPTEARSKSGRQDDYPTKERTLVRDSGPASGRKQGLVNMAEDKTGSFGREDATGSYRERTGSYGKKTGSYNAAPTDPGTPTRGGQTAKGGRTGATPSGIQLNDPSVGTGTRRRERSYSASHDLSSSNTNEPISLAGRRGGGTDSGTRVQPRQREPYRMADPMMAEPTRQARPLLTFLIIILILGAGYFIQEKMGPVGTKSEPRVPSGDDVITTEVPVQTADNKTFGECTLKATSDPPGASVIIEGQERGTTNTSIALDCTRHYNVTFKLDGYEQQTVNVVFNEKTKKAPVTLKKIPYGTLRIIADSNATAYLGDEAIGELTANQPFEHNLRGNRSYKIRFVNTALSFDETCEFFVATDVVNKHEIALGKGACQIKGKR